MDSTLSDLERCNKATAMFLKNVSSVAEKGEGEVGEFYQKILKMQKQAKSLEADQT